VLSNAPFEVPFRKTKDKKTNVEKKRPPKEPEIELTGEPKSPDPIFFFV